jgi:hypothetical protein
MQRRPAGDENLEARTGSEQFGDLRRGGEHVFEVVEQKQRLAVLEVSGEALRRRAVRPTTNLERSAEGWDDLSRVTNGRQLHEEYPVAERLE